MMADKNKLSYSIAYTTPTDTNTQETFFLSLSYNL